MEQQEIIAKLEKAGVNEPCPRCYKLEFTVIDGYFIHGVSDKIDAINLTGPAIPCIVTVCKSCGFLAQHAVKILDLV